MKAWLREALLGNWRNKGVALFFAVTIWYIAYQSEFRAEAFSFRVSLVPSDARLVVLNAFSPGGEGSPAPFAGNLTLHVNGSRKQIEELRRRLPARADIAFEAAAGPGAEITRTRHVFSARDLEFLRFSLIEIEKFSPEHVDLELDTRVEVEKRVLVSYPRPAGLEPEIERVEPAAVKLSGPRSVLAVAQPIAEASFQDGRLEARGKAAVKLVAEGAEPARLKELVRIEAPGPDVDLLVRLRFREDSLAREAVRVRFLVPVQFPYRIRFEDRAVPVVFKGPEAEIARLRDAVSSPDFFLAVAVPDQGLSPDKENDFTFTEDQLLLFGYSKEVQKLQHPSRKEKGLVAWSYTVIPIPSEEPKGP
jgi:hypothetical protein